MVEGSSPTAVKAWGGRFAGTQDAGSAAFTSSIGFDTRVILEDIRCSVAHVRMLGRQGIVPAEEAATIAEGLWTLFDRAGRGELTFALADEDVHTGVERHLRELIGPVQGKLHTARSRNDQVINDVRLWTKGRLVELAGVLIDLLTVLVETAGEHVETVMPGYTHTQRAQPVTLGHHLLAYVSMFERDMARLQETYARVDHLALGSAALAGTPFPIDRRSVAAELGFRDVTLNSLDAVSDRDFVIDTMYVCAMVAMHASRLCEELVWWSSGEIRFAEFGDAYSTGSSIMPQKKNPDVAELTRGKTGRVYGHLMGTLTMMKALPLAFNSDMQEDKEALFDTVDTMAGVLGILPAALRSVRFDVGRLAAAAAGDFSLATDAADLLARRGVPFREAHAVVGGLVRRCIERGQTFADLTVAEWAEVHPVFGEERPPLTALESVSARDTIGGTAPRRVRAAQGAAVERLGDLTAWQAEEGALMGRVMGRDDGRGSRVEGGGSEERGRAE